MNPMMNAKMRSVLFSNGSFANEQNKLHEVYAKALQKKIRAICEAEQPSSASLTERTGPA
jgi:hypothetical protein